MAARLPRWTWLLVLPMLVGALLLMHGLDAGASAHHGPTVAAQSVDAHSYADAGSHHDRTTFAASEDGDCSNCLTGDLMAACMAIIVTTIVGVGLARHRLGGGLVTALATRLGSAARGLIESARPPDPAWVWLSVMRC